MALSLGEQSARLGLHEAAARLFDISGEDSRLAGYLNGHLNGHTSQSGSQHEAAETAPDGIETQPAAAAAAEIEAAAADQLRALTSAREAGGGRGVGKAAGEVSAQAAGLFRRTSLLAGVVRFPNSQVGHVMPIVSSVFCWRMPQTFGEGECRRVAVARPHGAVGVCMFMSHRCCVELT